MLTDWWAVGFTLMIFLAISPVFYDQKRRSRKTLKALNEAHAARDVEREANQRMLDSIQLHVMRVTEREVILRGVPQLAPEPEPEPEVNLTEILAELRDPVKDWEARFYRDLPDRACPSDCTLKDGHRQDHEPPEQSPLNIIGSLWEEPCTGYVDLPGSKPCGPDCRGSKSWKCSCPWTEDTQLCSPVASYVRTGVDSECPDHGKRN